MVQGVCGSIGAEALGHCQIHEHIFVRQTPMAEINSALRIDNYEASLQELLHYKAHGGGSLVDAQPVAAGRCARTLKKLSRESGVTIIASTGFHLLGFYPDDCWVHRLGEEELYALYCGELRNGMLPSTNDGVHRPETATEVKAGMVKAAIPKEGPVGRYKALLRAAARAAVDADVPLMLHTERGLFAREALEICFAAGVRPQKLIVCHMDRQASDYGPHDEIAACGVYLDYDTIGRFKYHSDEEEVALLRHMVQKGFQKQLLLSLDTTARRLGAYGGEISLSYLLEAFLPLLRRTGMEGEAIHGFNVENCKRLFDG